jgi:hypothetical protein
LRDEGLAGHDFDDLFSRLAAVNARLWEIEDDIRACERDKDFGPRFVALARSVYVTNDERAELKRSISKMCESALVEEKSYDQAAQSRIP